MARFRLGQLDQARKDLENARQAALESFAAKPAPGKEVNELAWSRRKEIELFLAEAEAILAASLAGEAAK